MKIAVVGAGGVGGYFGGKLAASGNDVIFVARGEHLQAIRKNGLTVKSILGDFRIDGARATGAIGDLTEVDLVLLGVKAWQVREVAGQLKEVIKPGAVVLPLQNGILAAPELTGVLGDGRVIGGLCRIISRIEAPGVIRHSGLEPQVTFGELDNRKSRRTADLRGRFQEAGVLARVADDIQAELWKKFMAICVSGLLAVTRSTYGTVREQPETRRMMEELLGEIHAIALRSGIVMEKGAVARAMQFIDSFPSGSTSSLTRDVLEGRPSEIEYQNGTVVRLAEALGLDAPVNRFIYTCILPLERAARCKQQIP